MIDLLMIMLLVAAFAAGFAYVKSCARLVDDEIAMGDGP
jgi:hypothetical protein